MKQVDKYTAVKLEDGGQYGIKLIEGWVNDEGLFRPNFCKREFKKDSGEKTAPVSVKLGDKAKAIEVVLYLLKELTGSEYVLSSADARNSDIPF